MKTIALGQSVQGRPITMHLFGDRGEAVFVHCGIHGDEVASIAVGERLVEFLSANPNAYAGRRVGVITCANPDGYAKRRRSNANRVDLNRNFPASNWKRGTSGSINYGTSPVSEPETGAIVRAMQMLKPARIIAVHSIRRGRYCNNYDGPADALAQLMSSRNGYPARANIGYPTPGSFGTWAGVDQRIPTITLELPRGRSGDLCWEENRDALLAAIGG